MGPTIPRPSRGPRRISDSTITSELNLKLSLGPKIMLRRREQVVKSEVDPNRELAVSTTHSIGRAPTVNRGRCRCKHDVRNMSVDPVWEQAPMADEAAAEPFALPVELAGGASTRAPVFVPPAPIPPLPTLYLSATLSQTHYSDSDSNISIYLKGNFSSCNDSDSQSRCTPDPCSEDASQQRDYSRSPVEAPNTLGSGKGGRGKGNGTNEKNKPAARTAGASGRVTRNATSSGAGTGQSDRPKRVIQPKAPQCASGTVKNTSAPSKPKPAQIKPKRQ